MEHLMQNQVGVDGSWVTIDVYGDPRAAAIVIVPGVMADATAWQDVARGLRAWETVVVLNRRGRAPSGPLTPSYSLSTEVQDAAAVLRELPDVRTLFGWSYGGLIALHLANQLRIPQVIAYEPIMAPFGARALPDLRSAHEGGDLDAVVEIALREVTGMSAQRVAALRADPAVWAGLERLSAPLHPETLAINEAPSPEALAVRAARVDLIVGQLSRGRAPYGTSFEDVARLVPSATVHELEGQGHLAHLEAPARLAALVDALGPAAG